MTVTASDLDKLRHMLGVSEHRKRKDWGFRNYYNTSSTDEAMLRLAEQGWIELGFAYSADNAYWHATKEGCKAVGLTAAETKRALEDN